MSGGNIKNAPADLAERRGGSIRGVVDYQKWDATIDLYLPYAEFNGPADLKLLIFGALIR